MTPTLALALTPTKGHLLPEVSFFIDTVGWQFYST